jgi:hypothetical protein
VTNYHRIINNKCSKHQENWSYHLRYVVMDTTKHRSVTEQTANNGRATFNNISVISWRSVLFVEKTGVPGENHRPVANN